MQELGFGEGSEDRPTGKERMELFESLKRLAKEVSIPNVRAARLQNKIAPEKFQQFPCRVTGTF